jgi:hypothetical protein
LFLLALNVFTIVERERRGERHHEIPRARGDGRKVARREGKREREDIEQTNPFLDCASKP